MAGIGPHPFENTVHGGEGTLLMTQAHTGYWLRTLFAVKGRPVPPLGLTVFYALWITGATCLAMLGTEEARERGNLWIKIDTTVITVSGGALAFLLVFRTNSSYDRWWEGRRLWGSIINRSRNLARQAIAYVDDATLVEQLIRYLAAFHIVIKQHLRGERTLRDLSDPSRPLLTDAQVEGLLVATHVPLRVLDELSAIISKAKKKGLVDSMVAMEMDRNLTQFEDDVGGCERVLKTKLPFAYVVHLRTFLVIWYLAFPFALVEKLFWGTIPVSFVMFYLLTGIEMIGVEIENPFGRDYNDLPLETFNQTACDNLWQLLSRLRENAPEPNDVSIAFETSPSPGQPKAKPQRQGAWM
jgi:putative membrane protein